MTEELTGVISYISKGMDWYYMSGYDNYFQLLAFPIHVNKYTEKNRIWTLIWKLLVNFTITQKQQVELIVKFWSKNSETAFSYKMYSNNLLLRFFLLRFFFVFLFFYSLFLTNLLIKHKTPNGTRFKMCHLFSLVLGSRFNHLSLKCHVTTD